MENGEGSNPCAAKVPGIEDQFKNDKQIAAADPLVEHSRLPTTAMS